MYSTSDRIDDITIWTCLSYFYSTALKFGINTAFCRHKIVLLVHIHVELEMESSHGTGEDGRTISESF